MSSQYAHVSGGSNDLPPPDTPAHHILDMLTLADDCFLSALLMEVPAATATRLLGLVLASAHAALQETDERVKAEKASAIPEVLVRSMVNFATFVIDAGAPDLFGASRGLGPSMAVRHIQNVRSTLQCAVVHAPVALVLAINVLRPTVCCPPVCGSHMRAMTLVVCIQTIKLIVVPAGAGSNPARPRSDQRHGARVHRGPAARHARWRRRRPPRRRVARPPTIPPRRSRARRKRVRRCLLRRRCAGADGDIQRGERCGGAGCGQVPF